MKKGSFVCTVSCENAEKIESGLLGPFMAYVLQESSAVRCDLIWTYSRLQVMSIGDSTQGRDVAILGTEQKQEKQK